MGTKIYAGQVMELREGEFENLETNDTETILNIVIGNTKKLVGDIEVMVKQTAVLFRDIADQAKANFEVGDYILLYDVIRNPRVYVTGKGTKVETVDINLTRVGSVEKLDEAVYAKSVKDLTAMMLTEKDLEFAVADRVTITTALEANAADDTDVDKVFSK